MRRLPGAPERPPENPEVALRAPQGAGRERGDAPVSVQRTNA
ncbi:hypothetical protein [Methylorubrum zatmanii]|uniref:Uncharacterized protein n=1 Tax=Methylorubrum zatmanii TaxID=29429 RepID=A0ABW1WSV8_9HYPH|nr:hypothetical protein [Methylorubrum zatmanii]